MTGAFPHEPPLRAVADISMLTLNTLCIPRANERAPIFDRRDADTMELFFRSAPEFVFRQAWREIPSRDFAPANVRVIADDTALWIWADLTDDLPRNTATAPGQRTWELGDCFEIFLASSTEGPYYEIHVTPENQTLQLQAGSQFSTRPLADNPLRSATWLMPNGWQILAALPLDLLEDETHGWISFARYDYQSARREPVLSSTSPHREPNFHRRHEWTPFELQCDCWIMNFGDSELTNSIR